MRVTVASRLVGPVGPVGVLWCTRISRHRGVRSSGSCCSGRFECTVTSAVEGCDHSDRLRRKRRARGERGVGTGAPASLLERLLAQRMELRVCPFCRPFCPFELIFKADGRLK